MARSTRRTRSGGNRIIDRITGSDPKLRDAIARHGLNLQIAEMLLAAREAKKLTQAKLAKLVGTTQSVISRLESADYEGHSLSMLQRLADVLDMRVEVQFVPHEK